MKKMDILNKLVESDGNCDKWAKPSICRKCPLSKLKKKPSGDYLSCIEAIGAESLATEEEMNLRYKEVASRILLDETIDDILGAKDGAE